MLFDVLGIHPLLVGVRDSGALLYCHIFDFAAFQTNPAELVLWLIQQWYYAHREAGRPADPVFEVVVAQMDAVAATRH